MARTERRWRFARRWSGETAMPADALIAHTIRRELEAIIDRREWEPAEPPAAAVAVDTTPSDRAA